MNNPSFAQFFSEDPLFLVGICVTLACLLLGFAIGRLSVKQRASQEIKKAFEEGKNSSLEASAKEKAEISSELEHELLKVRESIIQSAKAYENTVKIVQEKLHPSGAQIQGALNSGSEAQLALDFENSDSENSDVSNSISEDSIGEDSIGTDPLSLDTIPNADAASADTIPSELEEQDTRLDFKIPEVRDHEVRDNADQEESKLSIPTPLENREDSKQKTVNSN